MSSAGQLVDCHGRVHTDLRVSVTDRCDFRCRYCMPAEGVHFRSHTEILRYEEIERFVRVASRLGIHKIRLTGGEPLVRKDLPQLVRKLASVPGIDDLALTTNGSLLGRYAAALKSSGLNRLNVSLDTLDRERFRWITRRDALPQVLEGIAAAGRAGFRQVKLNALAIRGFTEDEIVPLALFAREHRLKLRFIEFMPCDGDRQWNAVRVLPAEAIVDTLSRALGPLVPVESSRFGQSATEYRFLDGTGRIGIIRSVTEPFCGRCNRLRLTADGRVRNCLFSTEQWDVRAALRSADGEEQVSELIRLAVGAKMRIRGSDQGQLAHVGRAMHEIGG
ncbi:MAG: cyclic pyranopterin phosphate synthase MoaA [Planctomycetes bacterium RBG_13_63_9]|nr:MAG: cyclic pyranopterin phosphate synthase MoaA [Planctomycetes bacterium RBG_13_63_9]